MKNMKKYKIEISKKVTDNHIITAWGSTIYNAEAEDIEEVKKIFNEVIIDESKSVDITEVNDELPYKITKNNNKEKMKKYKIVKYELI